MHSKLLFETRSSTFRLHLIFEVSPFVEIRKSDREKRRTVCKHSGEIIEYTKRGVICIIRSQFCGKDAVIDCALIRERERERDSWNGVEKKSCKGNFFYLQTMEPCVKATKLQHIFFFRGSFW